jgi:hypothetical protein
MRIHIRNLPQVSLVVFSILKYLLMVPGVDMIKVRGFKFTRDGGAAKINKATKRAEQLVMKPWNA